MGPAGTEEQTRAAVADAGIVPDRYGNESSYYCNVSEARDNPSPDLTEGITGWNPLTDFIGDFGFVVVSLEEVGFFWSFDARRGEHRNAYPKRELPRPRNGSVGHAAGGDRE
ncbi:hypothetical protein ACPCC3_22320 [Streptomyces cellulosae]|nr:hypothetical protein OHA60_29920 [Streptomyces cellulosae]